MPFRRLCPSEPSTVVIREIVPAPPQASSKRSSCSHTYAEKERLSRSGVSNRGLCSGSGTCLILVRAIRFLIFMLLSRSIPSSHSTASLLEVGDVSSLHQVSVGARRVALVEHTLDARDGPAVWPVWAS